MDALLCEKEDAHSYFLLIQGLVQRRGLPVALYTDRHGVFRHTPGSGLPGMPAQFSRAMDELRNPDTNAAPANFAGAALVSG